MRQRLHAGGRILKENNKIVQVCITAIGSLLGAFLCLPAEMMHPPTNAELLRDFGIMAAGAILGGVFFSWASKR
jgi:hypothetical protein